MAFLMLQLKEFWEMNGTSGAHGAELVGVGSAGRLRVATKCLKFVEHRDKWVYGIVKAIAQTD